MQHRQSRNVPNVMQLPRQRMAARIPYWGDSPEPLSDEALAHRIHQLAGVAWLSHDPDARATLKEAAKRLVQP